MTNSKRSGFGWKRLLAVLLTSLTLLAGYQAIASAYDRRNYPPPGELVDVGDHDLHINCVGKGEPTVVMEAGMSGWSVDWVLVQPEIAKVTQVCTYDRAGYGWSETGPSPRDGQQVTTELHTLLGRTGLKEKYILVGHSLGGLFVQLYARRYPAEIAGIVLVDSVHQEQSLRMKEDVRKTYEGNLQILTQLMSVVAPLGLLRLANLPETVIVDKLPSESRSATRALGLQGKAYHVLAAEMASFAQSQRKVRKAAPLPAVPIIVLSSTLLRDFPPGLTGDYMKGLWDELQNDLARQPVPIQHIVAEKSGHYIHLDQPKLVIEAIVNLVRESGE